MQSLNFEDDIKNLFREDPDRSSMLNIAGFDLHKFEDVRDRADQILEMVENQLMPCDEPWPPERVEIFRKWINDGKLRDGEQIMTTNLQWRPTNAPAATSRTDDIWFVDPSTGWAVNNNGNILFTADGGKTWATQAHIPDAWLRCVGFANKLKGWVGTTTPAKRLYQTTDGGAHWTRVQNLPAVSPPLICGLSVVNESVVYASGTNYPNRPCRMIKTLDGGQTWTGWEMSAHATLLVDTFFTSPERGWVVGGRADVPGPDRNNVKPVILFTEDGGKTWVNRIANLQAQLPFGEWGWKIQFLNELVGFVSLENFNDGAIMKTTDGGLTWERKEINDQQGNANLEGIGFIDEDHGWVGGWGSANFSGGFSSATTDGGSTWENANEIGRFINRFRFFGDPVHTGYASGRTVYKYSSEPVDPGPEALLESAEILETSEPQTYTGSADIVYTVPGGAQKVEIKIWDRFGGEVRQLLDEETPAEGTHSVYWDFKDDAGEDLPGGIYIYRATVDDVSESRMIQFKKDGG